MISGCPSDAFRPFWTVDEPGSARFNPSCLASLCGRGRDEDSGWKGKWQESLFIEGTGENFLLI